MKKEAVLNFLSSADTCVGVIFHIENAHDDAKTYRWDDETLKAIIKGIWLKKNNHKEYKKFIKELEHDDTRISRGRRKTLQKS